MAPPGRRPQGQVQMLIAVVDWGAVGAIAGIVGVVVTLWQVRGARAKSHISVKAYVDEIWHMEVVVSNEDGDKPITIRSVAPRVSGKVANTKEKVSGKKIPGGETEDWAFEILPPKGANPLTSDVSVRVDSGLRHWTVKAERGHVLIS